jgi:hypothetical protein
MHFTPICGDYGISRIGQASGEADMLRLDRQVVLAGIIAVAGIAFVMTRSNAGDDAGAAKIYADNSMVVRTAAAPAPFAATAAARDVDAVRSVSGSEPDPESFDRDGLERWWSKYQKAHPAH